ncbi:MAG: hypothetical protein K8J31_09640, partial [Anaerolineae bacterium]|nr:hypothetical protein [Anaerolineae bacterium]
RRWYLALISIGLGLLLFTLEYRFVLATIPGLVALAGLFLRDRRLSLRTGLVLLAVTLAGGALGFFVVQHLTPGRQRIVLNVLTNSLWDGRTVLQYIGAVLAPLNLIPVLIVCVAGGVAYWLARRRAKPTINWMAFALFAMMVILLPWVISAVRLYGNETTFILVRHILPATALACVVLGAASAQIWSIIPHQTTVRVAFLFLFSVVLFGPQIPPMVALVQDREVQSWQVIIRQWADVNLRPGTVIVYNVHRNTFNPYWGGIPGRKWFDWWPTEDILEYPLDEWIQPRSMSYALIPIPQYRQLQQTTEGQALLDRMLRLRDFVHPPARREAEGIFFRLWRMQHETSIGFGSHITLTGFDQSTETIRPGETVDFTFYWNAPTMPEDNYSLFLHLVPDETYTVLAQADGAPAVPERPTLTWDEPSETLISSTFTLTAPTDLPPGHYRVMMGLYNFQTGVRLPVSGDVGASGDAYPLAEFQVSS